MTLKHKEISLVGRAALTLTLLWGVLLTGCGPAPIQGEALENGLLFPTPTQVLLPAEREEKVASTPTETPASTPRPLPTRLLAPTEPPGCLKPPDDYTLVQLNGYLVNQRTVAMLEHAAERYSGEIDVLAAITQGSYTDAVGASFGTHAGGGAVDLSVMRAGSYTVLRDEIEPLIAALREAGFAAWLRDLDELYPGSPIHIHAIAIGDRHLSPAAVQQLSGPSGYFRGLTGLPDKTAADRHGGPLICDWMRAAGYADLQPTPTPLPRSLEE